MTAVMQTEENLTVYSNDKDIDQEPIEISHIESAKLNRPMLLGEEERLDINHFEELLLVEKPDLSGRTMWSVFMNYSRYQMRMEDRTYIEKIQMNDIVFSSSTSI